MPAMKKKKQPPPTAITMGDPCGIGPEIIAKALSGQPSSSSFILVCAPRVMAEAVKRFGSAELKASWKSAPVIKHSGEIEAGRRLTVMAAGKLSFEGLEPGRPGALEGKAAWDCLEAGLSLVTAGVAGTLVTAPVTKSALGRAGFPFSGHTDWLEERAGGRAVMMMVSGRLRTAPVAAHLPLKDVPAAITVESVLETVRVVDSDLRKRFGIKDPVIKVTGLNPHAGEEGTLGREEDEVIRPALERARAEGVNARGPYAADALFIPEQTRTFDAAVCAYHDQAMIPVKSRGLDKAVNVTLGLPIVRTSPGHGSALGIAWKGQADHKSMTAAVKMAARLARAE